MQLAELIELMGKGADELVGKGAEILKYIAEKGPDKRELRRHWSSRTVWKQVRRLESQGWMVWQDDKYQATDHGLYTLVGSLIHSGYSAAAILRIVKIAASKFPDGATMRAYGRLREPGKRNMKEIVLRELEKPNAFLVCRTNAEGQVASLYSVICRPEDLRVSKRGHGRGWHKVFPTNPHSG